MCKNKMQSEYCMDFLLDCALGRHEDLIKCYYFCFDYEDTISTLSGIIKGDDPKRVEREKNCYENGSKGNVGEKMLEYILEKYDSETVPCEQE